MRGRFYLTSGQSSSGRVFACLCASRRCCCCCLFQGTDHLGCTATGWLHVGHTADCAEATGITGAAGVFPSRVLGCMHKHVGWRLGGSTGGDCDVPAYTAGAQRRRRVVVPHTDADTVHCDKQDVQGRPVCVAGVKAETQVAVCLHAQHATHEAAWCVHVRSHMAGGGGGHGVPGMHAAMRACSPRTDAGVCPAVVGYGPLAAAVVIMP